MKFKCFCIIILAVPFVVRSQQRITNASHAYYSQPSIHETHSVHLALKSFRKNDTVLVDKGVITRLEFNKGRISKEIEYCGKGCFTSFEYFYKDTSIIKCIVRYSGEGVAEVYYSYYDKTTNNLIREIGYAGKKVIYKLTNSKRKDTLFTRTYYNWLGSVATDYKRRYFTNDGLEEIGIEEREHHEFFRLSRKRYNARKQVVMEVDSGADRYWKTIYNYDSCDRVLQIKLIDSIEQEVKDFKYNSKEIIISTHYIYPSQQREELRELQTIHYDDYGNLFFEYTRKFEKGERGIELGKVIEKYYKEGRLQRTVVKSGSDLEYFYDIKYD